MHLRSLPHLFVPDISPLSDLQPDPGLSHLVCFLDPTDPLAEWVALLQWGAAAFSASDPVVFCIHLPDPEAGEALFQAALAKTGLKEGDIPAHLLFHVAPWEYPAVLAATQACLSLSSNVDWNRQQAVQALALNRPCLTVLPEDTLLSRLPVLSAQAPARESGQALLQAQTGLRTRLIEVLELSEPLNLAKILQTEILLIYFWGRSGSYFIQSLLDSHPEVLSTPTGALKSFHETWNSQLSQLLQERPQVSLPEMLDFFIETYPVLFHASPDSTFSNLDRLGPNQDQILQVDPEAFKVGFMGLYEAHFKGRTSLDRRGFFLLLHYAYELAQGRDISHKHLLVYQVHRPDLNRANAEVLADFPQARALGMVREPLRGLHSHLRMRVLQAEMGLTKTEAPLNGRSYDFSDTVSEGFYLSAYHHQLLGWKPLLQHYEGLKLYEQKLEALHAEPEAEMRKLADWLKIEWHPCLLESTFNGLAFWGDLASHRPLNGFSQAQTQSTAWENHFSQRDREILYCLLEKDLHRQGYGAPFPFVKWFLPLLIFWPSRLEQMAFEMALRQRNQAACEMIFLNLIKRWLISFAALFEREI